MRNRSKTEIEKQWKTPIETWNLQFLKWSKPENIFKANWPTAAFKMLQFDIKM